MTGETRAARHKKLLRFLSVTISCGLTLNLVAQNGPYERTFHQSRAAVEKALKQLQPAMSGRLPVLDGFATDRDQPLDRYQRGYYQSAVQVLQNPSGGCTVRVTAKVTAWYSDTIPSRSGYRLLTSNGRLENDLLDRLAEQLIGVPEPVVASVHETPVRRPAEPQLSAPMPNAKANDSAISSAMRDGISAMRRTGSEPAAATSDDHNDNGLRAEAAGLEEALKNLAHPTNLVVAKKSGTPVVATPSLTAKTLFTASMHDEFEMLDFNRDWVHVRISGLSRGWIWRDSLEMPDNIPDNPQTTMGPPPAADMFQVSREQIGLFPGDWEPLRGKSVKIVSVQKVQESAKDAGPQAKVEFAKFLLDKNYPELSRKSADLYGIVLIFDSVDGGMIAATSASIARWKAGKLSDSALLNECFFDPPETFSVSEIEGSQ